MRTNHMFAIVVYLQDRHDRSVLFGCYPSPDINALYKGRVLPVLFARSEHALLRSCPEGVCRAAKAFACVGYSDCDPGVFLAPRECRTKTANPVNRRCGGRKYVISAMKKTVNGGNYS